MFSRRARSYCCQYPGTALPPWIHYVPFAAKYECEAHEMQIQLRTADGRLAPAETPPVKTFRCNALAPDTAFFDRGVAFAKEGTAFVGEQGKYSVRFAPVRKGGKIVGVLVGRRRLDDDYRTASLPKSRKTKRTRRGELNAVNTQLMRDSEGSHSQNHRVPPRGPKEADGGAVALEPAEVVQVHRAHADKAAATSTPRRSPR
jgi:hypothetical protein